MFKIKRWGIFYLFIVVSFLYGSDEKGAKKLPDLRHTSYPELGVTTSGINLGYWYGRFGLRLSQYYFNPFHSDMVLNLGYKLYDNRKTQHSLNLLAGRYTGSDPGTDYDYAYLGMAYGLNFTVLGLSGFFVEAGIAAVLQDNLGNLDDDPLVPCVKLGYVYRFTPKDGR